MTTYVALLRGINVGGKKRVQMVRLKATFESVGSKQVSTYINSGNVLFTHRRKAATLAPLLEEAIAEEFGFAVEILLRDRSALAATAKAIPPRWKDDSTMRCYVMFLWEDVDTPDVVEELIIKRGIDKVRYVPGAIIWRVDRTNLTRSGMMRLTSSDLYRSMTIRNCNTVRKLDQLMTPGHQD